MIIQNQETTHNYNQNPINFLFKKIYRINDYFNNYILKEVFINKIKLFFTYYFFYHQKYKFLIYCKKFFLFLNLEF
jgi:hypothetical protein